MAKLCQYRKAVQLKLLQVKKFDQQFKNIHFNSHHSKEVTCGRAVKLF
jgi:hypothetical protein